MQTQWSYGFSFLICVSLYVTTNAFIKITDPNSDEEEVHINIRTFQNDVRQKRSADEFPDKMDIELPVGDRHVLIALHRNYHISNKVPITVRRHGKIVRQFIEDTQEVLYYYDRTSGSSFMVQRDNDPDVREDYDFFGTFHLNGSTYFIQPPDRIHKTHSISRVKELEPVTSDYIIADDLRRDVANRGSATGRYKRQTTVYEVEILMVADFSVFSFWKDRASGSTPMEKNENAKALMRQYYAFMLLATDLRYMSVTGDGYEIKCLFTHLHIADTAADATWTETIKNTATTPAVVNSSIALSNFKTWMNSASGGADLPAHDHAMLFTKHDLSGSSGTSNVGLAYLGGLCGNSKQSIIEDDFHATTGTVTAHELGHNIDARHDSDGNSCPNNTFYVMEATTGVSNDVATNLRLWEFSTCSVDYFTAFITQLNVDGTNCMTSRESSYNASALDEYIDQLAGQIYLPDEQCEIIYGTGSYLCRNFLDFNYSTICITMHCAVVPANNGTCYRRIPLEGTSCGNGKVCEKGHCVTSSLGATNLTETCLFGDQPQPVRNQGMSCTDLIGADQVNCYNYGGECCETCGVIAESYSNLTDCAYGDRSDCGTFPGAYCYGGENNLRVCCALCQNAETGIAGCEYGDKASWCGDPSLCALNSEVCCYSCRETTTAGSTTPTTTHTATSSSTGTMPTTSTTTPSTVTRSSPNTPTTTTTISTTTSSLAGSTTIDWILYCLLTAHALFTSAF